MAGTRSILLFPFSLLYGLITGIRNFLYDAGILSVTSFQVPVICIGNITVGGTGKTPHTEYLADLLKDDFKVSVLSRGYKRITKGFMTVTPESTPEEAGDEPSQISRKYPGIRVAVDKDRVNGITTILEKFPETNVILLDDGFQHRKVKPGLSILLTDYGRPFYRDYLLPYGNLREWRSNVKRADIIVITKCPKNIKPIEKRLAGREVGKAPYQNLFFTSFSYKAPLPVFPGTGEKAPYFDLTRCHDSGIVLLTGIANPAPLREYLGKFFSEIKEMIFPDHHAYTQNDIEKIRLTFQSLNSASRFVMTTEKDAIRLNSLNIENNFRKSFYYIPVGIHFVNDDKDKFDSIITGYVGKNKKYS